MAKSEHTSRSEITEKVEKHHEDMDEKGKQVELDTVDIEIVRDTLDAMEGGTAEGFEGEGQAIEAAEDTGIGEFDEASGELEDVHGESEEHEGELQETGDTVSSDLGKISDASAEINSDGVNSELINAKEEAIRDKEFLDEQENVAKDAREESRRLHDEHQSRVNSGRRT